MTLADRIATTYEVIPFGYLFVVDHTIAIGFIYTILRLLVVKADGMYHLIDMLLVEGFSSFFVNTLTKSFCFCLKEVCNRSYTEDMREFLQGQLDVCYFLLHGLNTDTSTSMVIDGNCQFSHFLNSTVYQFVLAIYLYGFG